MIAILGAGESGVGAALLAQAKGIDVFVSDKGEIQPFFRKKLQNAGIAFEEGKHTAEKILAAGEIIKSPGIPDTAEIVKLAKEKQIPVISEIEFAGRYTNAKFIGITGTNGKTTTTLLTFHLLKNAGFKVALAGNVGESLAVKVIDDQYDWYVLELSSFQLDDMFHFPVHIGILTNITPDHLDRYDYKIENYAKSKLRLTQNMTPADYFIFNQDDPLTAKYFSGSQSLFNLVPVSLEEKAGAAFYYNNNLILSSFSENSSKTDTSKSTLIGKHNQYNTLMAVAAAKLAGVTEEQIEKALPTFQNAGHRLQIVGEAGGITYINDSKATNVEAVYYALEGIKQPIVWIAGGVDKGNDYEVLFPLAKLKVKALICLGTDNEKLKKAFQEVIPVIEETQDIEQAVLKARNKAERGEVVLLSPACASFDLFKNYEHRGHRFMEAVQRLILEPVYNISKGEEKDDKN